MKANNSYSLSRSLRKSLLLLGVYALHLIFFQALMAAPTQTQNKNFKPLFINHDKKAHAINHPAVSYCSILLKQASSEVPSFNTAAIISPTFSEIIQHPFVGTIKTYRAHIDISHLADDTFKLYRVLGVFLI
ncbi:MAG: hypothetical protein JWO06_21 [Bacteroidota bacterium]|nr:hypothetical protein [Bacteroidota bacterium]